MNDQLQEFAKKNLKDSLSMLPAIHQMLFKRMYSHTDLEVDINDVVDRMDSDRLNLAMLQVQSSVNELNDLG